MGVKHLFRIINKEAPLSIIEKQISDYGGKILAIDVMLIIYKYVIGIRGSGSDMKSPEGDMTSHLYAIMNKTIFYLINGILPIYIFDGEPPEIKKDTLIDRKNIKTKAKNMISEDVDEQERIKSFKKSFFITHKHIQECKDLLDLMGIPYVQSIGEADPQCAAIVKSSHLNVYGVVSDDMDELAFSTPIMLRSHKNKIIEIQLKNVLIGLGLTMSQFIELCVILGTDYCGAIKGSNAEDLFKLYKKCGDMETFLKYIENANNKVVEQNLSINEYNIKNQDDQQKYIKLPYIIGHDFERNWKHAKRYFQSAEVIDTSSIDTKWKKPMYDKFRDFMLKKGFDTNLIDKDTYLLKKHYTKYVRSNAHHKNS